MVQKILVSLLSLAVLATVVGALPSSTFESKDHDSWPDQRVDESKHEIFDWLEDTYDDIYDTDNYRDQKFHLFLSITKSLRTLDYDHTSLNKLYKTFLRGVFHKTYSGDLTKLHSNDNDDSGEWDDLFDDDDFDYKDDNDHKNEKAKRLFMYYLKFKAHCQAQREIEKLYRHIEQKARKQFALFSELVAFVEKVKFQKEMAKKFSSFVELKLKEKFDSFKKCFYHEQCDKDDDNDVIPYRTGEWKTCFNMEGGNDYDNDGKHFELFLKLYKSVSLISYDRDSHEVEDIFPGWDFHNDDDDDDDDDWKDKHPIFRFIAYLQKYLSNHSPRQFWGRLKNEKDNAHEIFLFFAIKAYKELKEEKAMKDRQEKLEAIFAHFVRFIKYQEDNERIKASFYKFQKWQQIKDNQDKLEEFSSFLKTVAEYKKTDAYWGGRDELIQKFDRIFEYKKRDYRDDSSEENDFGHLFSKYIYRKQRSHWNRGCL